MASTTTRRRTTATGGERAGRPRRGLSGRPRRLLRAAHVVVSGGWTGLVVAMLVLGVTATTTGAPEVRDVAYLLMGRIGRVVIPPLAVATLVSGAALSLTTPWGLARHWWVVVKIVLGLTVIVTAVTLTDAWISRARSTPVAAGAGTRLVVGSGVHVLMLGLATVVSVDKPWGRTPRGRRRVQRRRSAARS